MYNSGLHGLQAEKATLAKQAGGAVEGKKGEKDEYAQALPGLLRQSNWATGIIKLG